MSFKKIDYVGLTNKALLAVVKDILTQISKAGLFKKQHLYITFATRHPGVQISDILREDFEEELTIILEHEFWDLVVDDYGFSVSLEFEHGSETLYIPFSSIISVSDPSEDFTLDFMPNFADLSQTKSTDPEKPVVKNNVISLAAYLKGN